MLVEHFNKKMPMWHSKRYLLLTVAMLIVIGAIITLMGPSVTELSIATGTPGGTYILIGEGLSKILNRSTEEPLLKVTPLESAGTVQTIDWLTADPPEAQLGFVATTALVGIPVQQAEQIRLIAELYEDVVQVVVRKDSGIKSLGDLRDKRVYVGKDGSGTQVMAREMLDSVGVEVTVSMRNGTQNDGLSAASEKLVNGDLDATIFMAGTPTAAVKQAMESGECELLDLAGDWNRVQTIPGFDGKYRSMDIPANFYENQTTTVQTISTKVRLVGRKDLEEDVVVRILDDLFDHTPALLAIHAQAQDIRFEMPAKGAVVDLHPGTERFWKEISRGPLIATGAIGGLYYSVGEAIREALEPYDIDAQVFHTEGSVENVNRITDREATVAIMQYDIALASYWGVTEPIYGVSFPGIPEEPGLRRIAALHPEKVHILVRRDSLKGIEEPSISDLAGLRVCLGPENSGTQYLAQTILRLHEIDAVEQYLSVRAMVNRLNAGEIDAGFLAAGVPSEALRRVLADPGIRLLSVEPRKMTELGRALKLTTIEEQTYGCQLEGEPPIRTLETQAVLLMHQNASSAQVRDITRAIVDSVGFLGIEGGAHALARDLPSLPFHPAAKQYYQENEILPPGPNPWDGPLDLLKATWQLLAIAVLLLGGYKGLLTLRRDVITQQEARRILAAPVNNVESHPISWLMEIKREMRERVNQRWWRFGEIDRVRWQGLEDLANAGIFEAKKHLMRALLSDIRQFQDQTQQEDTSDGKAYAALKDRIEVHLVTGELDIAQYDHLEKRLSEIQKPPDRSSDAL